MPTPVRLRSPGGARKAIRGRARPGKDPHDYEDHNDEVRHYRSACTAILLRTDEDAIDRLAGLLPAEELEDALKGLEPEQITGPGGLLTQLAGRVIDAALWALS